jgi:hypothetical protein
MQAEQTTTLPAGESNSSLAFRLADASRELHDLLVMLRDALGQPPSGCSRSRISQVDGHARAD